MYFIRHYKLQAPYEDYTRLSVAELDALAQHHVDPPIVSIGEAVLTPDLRLALAGAEIVYCSPSLRARQTAEQLNSLCGGGRRIEVDERLAELSFVPSLLMRNAQEHPLTAVRERLYAAMEAGEPHVSDVDMVLRGIRDFMAEREGEKCCVVAHGFLMRLLVAADGAGSRAEMFERVEKVPPVGYLEVREVGL